MKTKKYRMTVFLMLMLFVTFLSAVSVFAASAKLVSLKPGKTYKKYDVTGDGKVDRIKISKQTVDKTVRQAPIYSVKVTVNKKISFNVSSAVKKVDLRCFYKGKKGVLISSDFCMTAGNEIFWYKLTADSVTKTLISKDAHNAYMKKSGSSLVLTLYNWIGHSGKKTTKKYRLKGTSLVG